MAFSTLERSALSDKGTPNKFHSTRYRTATRQGFFSSLHPPPAPLLIDRPASFRRRVLLFFLSLSLFSSPFLSQNHRSSSLESRDPLNRAKPRFTITDSYSRPALFTSRAERRKTIETPLTVCRGKHVPFKYVGARNASTPMCPSGTGLCLGRAVRRK